MGNNWITMANKFYLYSKSMGVKMALKKAYAKLKYQPYLESEYAKWIAKYDTVSDSDINEIEKDICSFKYKPLISIIFPVYNTNIIYLKDALESVRNQIYQKWELCISDDASTNPKVKELLKEYQKTDIRIKVVYRQENGHISMASNSAIEMAEGEYIALMDHDDYLPMHALYMIVKEINRYHNEIDLIYTDEDKIDAENRRYNPYFKPDWNPTMIYAQNFVAHLGVYRTSIVKSIGAFRKGFEGSQDFDLLLRFLKCTTVDRIVHIPRILYHWRIFSGNHTFSTDNQNISDNSAYKALCEYFGDDNHINIRQIEGYPGIWHVEQKLSDNLPLVSIIIPTKDKIDVLQRCINSIIEKTNYSSYEIIVVDNNSVEHASKKYFDTISKRNSIKVISYDKEFNYSAINNYAAKISNGEFLLFLNNDTEVISPLWLDKMMMSIQRKGVGIVGAKLYYPNETVQHCGVTLGTYGIASHTGRHRGRKDSGYFANMIIERNVSAVTGACLLISRAVFDEVHGFDEENLKVSYNDVDLCLKVRNAGYYIVVNPQAELFHYESVSRGQDETIEQRIRNRQERHVMYLRYGHQLMEDPYYSPNLSLMTENYDMANYPRIGKPWRDWIEFVCPFHRGDVLLGTQIAYTAFQKGIKVRMHVSKEILPWIMDFEFPFPVEPVPQGIPSIGQTYQLFQEAMQYVAGKKNCSGLIIGSHPQFDFDFLGLDIVENMLHEFRLPIMQLVDNFKPKLKPMPEADKSIINSKTILFHPHGGWALKSLPKRCCQNVIQIMHNLGYQVIQIGGLNDSKIDDADGWLLKNESLGYWRSVFESAFLLIGVDSWTAHFASILDVPQITLYGPTNARDVNSKKHFMQRNAPSLICDTAADCSPCHSFVCLRDNPVCDGFDINSDKIGKFVLGIVHHS